ncbi:MAG: hypothetical protein ACO3ZY_11710, partial [Phycisphaerales bacterium]
MVRHAGEGSWEALLAVAADGAVRVRERRRLAAEALGSWLDEQRAGTRLAVIPSAATICRMFRL